MIHSLLLALALALETFSPERAMEHVRVLAETIGSRPKGSAALVQAGSYVGAQLAGSGLDVHLQEFSLGDARGWNTIGETAASGQAVIIGAHLDSVPAGPGANDDASGIAVLLEVARVATARPYPFALRFVAFDGEEPNRDGSGAYVDGLADPSEVLAYINLDMVGAGGRLELGGDPSLAGLAWQLAEARLLDAGPLSREVGGDWKKFAKVGVPVLTLSTLDRRMHTSEDRAEYIEPGRLADAGSLVLAVLDELHR